MARILQRLNALSHRTYKSPNELRIYADHAEIVLYDKMCNEIGTCLISLHHVEKASRVKWGLTEWGYVRGIVLGRSIFIHRYLLDVTDPSVYVDHRYGNKLDNREHLLRTCTKQQNAMNARTPSNSTTGIKGVSYEARRDKWRAHIKLNGKQLWLGYHETKEQAVRARLKAERTLFAEFRCIRPKKLRKASV